MTLINSEYGKRGGSEMLQVIKRDGTKVPFDKHKIAVAIEKAEHSFNLYLSRDARYYTQTQEMLFELSELKNNIIGYKEEIAMAVTDLERRCREYEEMEREAYLKKLEQQRLNLEMQKIQEQRRAREQREREIRMKEQADLRRKQNEKRKKAEDKKENKGSATSTTRRLPPILMRK